MQYCLFEVWISGTLFSQKVAVVYKNLYYNSIGTEVPWDPGAICSIECFKIVVKYLQICNLYGHW